MPEKCCTNCAARPPTWKHVNFWAQVFPRKDSINEINTYIGISQVSIGDNSLIFKASLSAKFFLCKYIFIHMESRTNYHNKNFALRLALKRRQT